MSISSGLISLVSSRNVLPFWEEALRDKTKTIVRLGSWATCKKQHPLKPASMLVSRWVLAPNFASVSVPVVQNSPWEVLQKTVWTCPCVPYLFGIWKCRYLRRGECRSTRIETSRSKEKDQQQTQPQYGLDAGIWTPATLVGGRCSYHYVTLAPLSNHLAGHAPHLPRQKNQTNCLV